MRSRLFCNLLVLGVLVLGGCAAEGDDDDDDNDDNACQQGATQACVCAGGEAGGQVCDDGAWDACQCGEDNPADCDNGETQACTCASGDSGAQSCLGGFWQPCACEGGGGPAIGDPCFASDDCDGSDLPLLCVLQNGDDIQGICTITCGDFGDCLGGPVPAFYDCCDLANGSSACAPSDWECDE
jgi:hypothetical protein